MKNFIQRFLNSALVEKYDVTSTLIGKSLWPFTALLLAIIFYSDVSILVKQFAKSLSRTSRVSMAGVEIEVYADSLRGSDFEAYEAIRELNKEEILFILERGEIPFKVQASYLTPEEINEIKIMVDKGILDSSSLPNPDADPTSSVNIELTDFGIRVYRELQSIIINFADQLPSDEKE